MNNLENLIKNYASLSNHPSSNGWFYTTCAVCNDYKPRAGFKFSNDGQVVYHCFNERTCGGGYNPPETAGFMSKNMRRVLDSFGIPKQEYQQIIFDNIKLYSDNPISFEAENKEVERDYGPQPITIPDHFVKLSEASGEIAEFARLYIEDRGVDWKSYPFYVSTGKSTTDPRVRDWAYRVIIPAYKNNKLIYYQGRDLLDDHKRKKYLSCSHPAEKVLYFHDELYNRTSLPLFVVEGFFDALLLHGNAVSCMSSNLTEYQIKYLNLCSRNKVIVPDLTGNGVELAEQALEQGWSISIPYFKNCKDINDAVKKYGKLYVIDEIMRNIKNNFEAELSLNMLKNGVI